MLTCDVSVMLTLAIWQTCIWCAALCPSHPYNNKSMSTKHKKRPAQQFLECAALLSHLGMSWGFGSEFAVHGLLRVLSHFVAGEHLTMGFLAGLPGIKWCCESIWSDLLSSPKRMWGGGKCHILPLNIKIGNFKRTYFPSAHTVSLCAQGFPGDFGEMGPPGPDGNPVSEMM